MVFRTFKFSYISDLQGKRQGAGSTGTLFKDAMRRLFKLKEGETFVNVRISFHLCPVCNAIYTSASNAAYRSQVSADYDD